MLGWFKKKFAKSETPSEEVEQTDVDQEVPLEQQAVEEPDVVAEHETVAELESEQPVVEEEVQVEEQAEEDVQPPPLSPEPIEEVRSTAPFEDVEQEVSR